MTNRISDNTHANNTRQAAANQAAQLLDAKFFRALCEPVRIEVISILIRKGRSDIAAIADELPQHRSVISRHLLVLEREGLLRTSQHGRHVFYELDAANSVRRFEEILNGIKALVPLCCPDEPQ